MGKTGDDDDFSLPDDIRERALRRIIVSEIAALYPKIRKGHEISRARVEALLHCASLWKALCGEARSPKVRAQLNRFRADFAEYVADGGRIGP